MRFFARAMLAPALMFAGAHVVHAQVFEPGLTLSDLQAKAGVIRSKLGVSAADTIKAIEFGVVCDGSTVVSTQMQNAINAAEAVHKVLDLPGGQCLVNNLLISTALTMRGQGEAATTLYSPAGSSHPTITVQVSTPYSPGGVTTTTVLLEDFRISGSRGDTANKLTANGISFLDSGAHNQTRLRLDGVTIEGVAGDGIYGPVNPSSWLEAYGSIIQFPGNNGIEANSVADWKWVGGGIDGAIEHNLLLAGVGHLHFIGVDFYVPGKHNVYLYGNIQAVDFVNCHFDLAGQNGFYSNMTTGSYVNVIDSYFRWSSQSAANTYADIFFEAASGGSILLHSSHFTRAADNTYSANNPQFNVYFDPTTTASLVTDAETVFDAGLPLAPGPVTNDPTKFVGQLLTGLGTSAPGVMNLDTSGSKYNVATPSSGDTLTMAQGQRKQIVANSSNLSALTIKLPPNPTDGASVVISSQAGITLLHLQNAAGTAAHDVSVPAFGSYEATYCLGCSSWE